MAEKSYTSYAKSNEEARAPAHTDVQTHVQTHIQTHVQTDTQRPRRKQEDVQINKLFLKFNLMLLVAELFMYTATL